MNVAVLGSGSAGNSTVVGRDGFWVLVDAGFSGKQVEERLARVGLLASDLHCIVVTHEHGDHTRGIGVLARRHGLPLYLTPGTRDACASLLRGGEEIREYHPGLPFEIGPLRFDPFLTVHDAVDPVAITVTGKECGTRVGIATDLGRPTTQIRHSLDGCHFLILEANHDERLLQEGPYPPRVKERIASSHGHLSNHAAARFACELLHPLLVGVVLAHLSKECNEPELAHEVVNRALTRAGYRGLLAVARQDEPTELVDVAGLLRRHGPEQLSLL